MAEASPSPHASSSEAAPPKVSCLLVTADRPTLCRRAIRCYRQQTYPNTELVVLDNGVRQRVEHLLEDLPAAEVRYRYVERTPDLWIGGLRNQSLDMATGDFVVPQWDDDDWSHPERLARQAAVLQEGYDAVTLAGTLMHVDRPAYFDHPFVGLLDGGVPPTIMHRRDAAIRYPNIRRTSDTAFVNQWQARRYRILPYDDAYLYLRYFHGDNLWEVDHFLRRMRNTPKDFLLYAWYRFVRGDVFKHPRFRLTPAMRAAFRQYLDDSFRFDLFQTYDADDYAAGRVRSASTGMLA